MKLKQLYIVALSAACLVGCGQAHQSHGVIEDFMESSMHIHKYDVVSWSDVKVANFVSDSTLAVMHREAEKAGLVERGVKYVPRTEQLNFVRVMYVFEKDTIAQTFYLNDKNTGVVGFKAN